jgi:CDP-glucose 4,6-dehydratase
VTGHTGFTGSWLVSWLKRIGCDVACLALAPTTEPSPFVAANIADGIRATIGDTRDFATVRDAIARHPPSVIVHLAGQPLVSKSFEEPIGNDATNALGTDLVERLGASWVSPEATYATGSFPETRG